MIRTGQKPIWFPGLFPQKVIPDEKGPGNEAWLKQKRQAWKNALIYKGGGLVSVFKTLNSPGTVKLYTLLKPQDPQNHTLFRGAPL